MNECVTIGLERETIRATSVRHSMTQKGIQTVHFLCFMSDINVLRKVFEKTGNYIQPPIDICICAVNLRVPTSRILAALFFVC